MDSNSFFIKDGYQASERASTLGPAYWNPRRVKAATIYQYHVYQLCAGLAAQELGGEIRFLDVGCGPPVKVRALLRKHCRDMVLLDQAPVEPLAAEILPEALFHCLDLEQADLDLGPSFDLVVSADVVEHLLDPESCLALIRRHLSPTGLAVISTPERDVLRGPEALQSGHPHHVREWNGAEFARLLRHQGFEVVRHLLLPQGRLNRVEFWLSRWLGRWWRRPRWSGCQTAVCRLPAGV